MNNNRLLKVVSPVFYHIKSLSNKSAIFTKPHRRIYARLYPTSLVYSNGASVSVRYPEPRKIIRLPLDLDLLTEAERRERLEKRKPKKKIVIEDDVRDSFNANKYVKFIKKK